MKEKTLDGVSEVEAASGVEGKAVKEGGGCLGCWN